MYSQFLSPKGNKQPEKTMPDLLWGATVKGSPILTPISVQQLFEKIKNGENNINSIISEIRRLKQINPQVASSKKENLPFFIGAVFDPPVRRKNNLVRINYLLLDLDYISKHSPTQPHVLKKELASDKRVLMAFVSPGGDGIKLLFRLSEPCFDTVAFKRFYLTFAQQFADEHQLGNMVDKNCNDVTRVSFLSFDPEAICKTDAETLPFDNFAYEQDPTETELPIFDQSKPNKPKTQPATKPLNPQPGDLTADKLKAIKDRLNPNRRPEPVKKIYVPQEILEIETKMVAKIKEFEIELTRSTPISYGKRLTFEMGNKWCEINIFYGKKGFSAVRTPKRGSDDELGQVAKQLVDQFLEGNL